MQWDRFFEDLEDQLASEWEAERAALDTEAERLRLSRVTLRERLHALIGRDGSNGTAPTFEFVDGSTISAEVSGLGVDWVALQNAGRGRSLIVPLGAVCAIAMAHADVLRSARPAPAAAPSALADRMTFGFVLRDLVRRRVCVSVQLANNRLLTGTIDRAGADHLDIALHDAGAPRRSDIVSGHRVIPLGAVAWVRLETAASAY
ncbi:hypothetical protein [Microbacterium sp. P01]|uniref:hypothetical protein n=1 Tax=unclassified Microbacterium TaxID=2609290 RepID=UPI0036705E63